jgi:carbon storage regulator
MLVLTRKLNETIIINGDIRVKVVGIRGNHVRLGIEAPPHVRILRSELSALDDALPADVAPEADSAQAPRRALTHA